MNREPLEEGVGRERMPPPTFNQIKNAYRPGSGFPTIKGLAERVQALVGETRFRTAMDDVLRVLMDDPSHQEALMLAVIIIGATSRTQGIQAREPLTPAYLGDTRLDPIFAVCSACNTSAWVPVNCLFAGGAADTLLANPIGMQCYSCGYVVCRECMQRRRIGPGGSTISQKCPNCGKKDLGIPVYPTGRTRQQMARYKGTVTQVFVLRSGPIPPDRDYMINLLETYSPDALEDDAQLVGLAVSPWPNDIEEDFASYLESWTRKGNAVRGTIRERAEVGDDLGNRVYLIKLVESSAAADPQLQNEPQISLADVLSDPDDSSPGQASAKKRLRIHDRTFRCPVCKEAITAGECELDSQTGLVYCDSCGSDISDGIPESFRASVGGDRANQPGPVKGTDRDCKCCVCGHSVIMSSPSSDMDIDEFIRHAVYCPKCDAISCIGCGCKKMTGGNAVPCGRCGGPARTIDPEPTAHRTSSPRSQIIVSLDREKTHAVLEACRERGVPNPGVQEVAGILLALHRGKGDQVRLLADGGAMLTREGTRAVEGVHVWRVDGGIVLTSGSAPPSSGAAPVGPLSPKAYAAALANFQK